MLAEVKLVHTVGGSKTRVDDVEYEAPPNTKISTFQLRSAEDERNRRGGQFWQDWLPVAGRLVIEASTFFEAQPSKAPPEAPHFEDVSQRAVSLVWEAPLPLEASPEPLGYKIEWQRVKEVDKPLKTLHEWGDEWGDALSSLPVRSNVAKGEACCTWKKTTRWRLSAADLLKKGEAYRFRVRAVNRMGASEPSAPSQILHWPPPWVQSKENDDSETKKNTTKEDPELTEACENYKVSQADLFASDDEGYTFQSKPPTERQLTDEQASAALRKLTMQFALEGDETKLGFIFLFSMLTGRFELVFDTESQHSADEKPASSMSPQQLEQQLKDRLEHQLRDMEVKHDQKEKNRLPEQTWFNEPLTPEVEAPETPNWLDALVQLQRLTPDDPLFGQGTAARESVTAARLLVQADVLLRCDRLEAPTIQPHLYALLSIIVAFLELEPHRMRAALQELHKANHELPAFPIERNRDSMASSNGLQPKRGQVWTFLKEAFAWAREAVVHLPDAAVATKAKVQEVEATGMHMLCS